MTAIRTLHRTLFFAACVLFTAVAATAQLAPALKDLPALAHSRKFRRQWSLFQQRAYPLGSIPSGARVRGLEQLQAAMALRGSNPSPALPSTGGWVNIGPAPIIDGGLAGSAVPGAVRPASGRVAAVAVDPHDTTHWLAGTAQGGIWETRDTGLTWVAKTDDQASLAIGALSFAPSNSNIIYAGTGEENFAPHSYAGAGLLKSTDGGSTWQLLAASTFAETTFNAVRVHPTNPNLIEVATGGGIAGRGSAIPPAPPPAGILRSTDGGITWTRVLHVSGYECNDPLHPVNCTEGTALEIDRSNFNRQYAGIGFPSMAANGANGLYRSTDGGLTWNVINGQWNATATQVGRIALALAPSDPNVLYVAIQDALVPYSPTQGGGLLGIWQTTNAWAATPTFTSVNTSGMLASQTTNYCEGFNEKQCWYDNVLSVDPTNANVLFAGGITLWKYNGSTWTEVSNLLSDLTNAIHVDQHSLAWAGSRLIVGNDGGVWSTTDGGVTWADHNTNLSTIQFYDGSVHPTNPSFALGGSQDNGTVQWTGTSAWHEVHPNDGAANAIAAVNPDTNWAVSDQNLMIFRTLDGGTLTPAYGGIDRGTDPRLSTPFIAQFAKCPSNDDVFIAGTSNLWKTTNFFSGLSPSWTLNSPDMGQQINPFFGLIGISALAFAPSDTSCNTYAFADNASQLLLTTDGGGSWATINPGLPDRYITGLTFDPTNANVLYVTMSGFDEGTPTQPGHVFKATNALSATPTWSNVSPPVDIPHNTILVDGAQPNLIYVGTDLGVWISLDGAATWSHMGPESGMPNVAVFDLQKSVATGRLIAFTLGRGAFVLTGNTVAKGSFDLLVDDSVVPSTFTGRATYADATFTPFGTPINLGQSLGSVQITCGALTSFTPDQPPALGGSGTFSQHTEASPPSLLTFDVDAAPFCGSMGGGSGEFVCPAAGCNSTLPDQTSSLVSTIANLTGSVGNLLTTISPPGTVFTIDGTDQIVSSIADLPGCNPPASQHRCFSGNFFMNAFAPSNTGVSANPVTVSFDAHFFSPVNGKEVPVTVDVTYEGGVSSPGSTTISATSNAAGNVADNFALSVGSCMDQNGRPVGSGCATDADCPAGDLCAAFTPSFFDLTTTATVGNPRTVCVHYPDVNNDGIVDGTPVPAVDLRLIHRTGSDFLNVTQSDSPDTVNKVVCGSVSGFSPFVLAALAQLPGGGGAKTDCISEWGVGNQLTFGRRGRQQTSLVCRDGAACDLGNASGECTFSINVCAAVNDPRIPACLPTDVARYTVLGPLPDARNATDASNASALLTALSNLGAHTVSGRHLNVLTFDTPLTNGACTAAIPITVPVRVGSRGSVAGTKTLRLRAQTSSGTIDTDTLRLVCTP